MDKDLLKLYSWLVRGKQRRTIIKVMNDIKTPTQIKEETKLSLNNVSDIIRLFIKKGIAKCLNEEDKVGRLYKLTKKGEEIRKEIIR